MNSEKSKSPITGTHVFWGIIIILIIIGFSSDSEKSTKSSYNSNYQTQESSYDNDSSYEDTQTFHGNDCTDDCSGHEAGYNWAEKNSISDEGDCSTASNSFNEGCISYVEENN